MIFYFQASLPLSISFFLIWLHNLLPFDQEPPLFTTFIFLLKGMYFFKYKDALIIHNDVGFNLFGNFQNSSLFQALYSLINPY